VEEKILKEIYDSLKKGEKVALATIIQVNGSAPRKNGSMMAVWQQGRILGSVGGGKVENEVIIQAINCLEINEDRQFEHKLNEKGALGMVCGGEVKGFIKVFNPRPRLLIVGGGHIGEELYKLGKLLNFYTVIFDDRKEFANEEKFNEADEVFQGSIAENLTNFYIGEKDYIVIVTRGHEQDGNALKAVVSRGAAYIGMIGSSRKNQCVIKKLMEEGASKEELDKVYAPIGLDIASERPEEIAFAILSEILLIKNQGSLNHMRDMKKGTC
jgi:xanthine dehydrogenase accessory factor